MKLGSYCTVGSFFFFLHGLLYLRLILSSPHKLTSQEVTYSLAQKSNGRQPASKLYFKVINSLGLTNTFGK